MCFVDDLTTRVGTRIDDHALVVDDSIGIIAVLRNGRQDDRIGHTLADDNLFCTTTGAGAAVPEHRSRLRAAAGRSPCKRCTGNPANGGTDRSADNGAGDGTAGLPPLTVLCWAKAAVPKVAARAATDVSTSLRIGFLLFLFVNQCAHNPHPRFPFRTLLTFR